jgi:uncharacterized UBP type Zn finger protein
MEKPPWLEKRRLWPRALCHCRKISAKVPTTTQSLRHTATPATSTRVKHALGDINARFLTNAQQDAHECFTAILDGLKETDEEENEVFGFKIIICRECKSCKRKE